MKNFVVFLTLLQCHFGNICATTVSVLPITDETISSSVISPIVERSLQAAANCTSATNCKKCAVINGCQWCQGVVHLKEGTETFADVFLSGVCVPSTDTCSTTNQKLWKFEGQNDSFNFEVIQLSSDNPKCTKMNYAPNNLNVDTKATCNQNGGGWCTGVFRYKTIDITFSTCIPIYAAMACNKHVFPIYKELGNGNTVPHMEVTSATYEGDRSHLTTQPSSTNCEDQLSCSACGNTSGCVWCQVVTNLLDDDLNKLQLPLHGYCADDTGMPDVCDKTLSPRDFPHSIVKRLPGVVDTNGGLFPHKFHDSSRMTCSDVSWPKEFEFTSCNACVANKGYWTDEGYCMPSSFKTDTSGTNQCPTQPSVDVCEQHKDCQSCNKAVGTSGEKCVWCGVKMSLDSTTLPLVGRCQATDTCASLKIGTLDKIYKNDLFRKVFVDLNMTTTSWSATEKYCGSIELQLREMLNPSCDTCTTNNGVWVVMMVPVMGGFGICLPRALVFPFMSDTITLQLAAFQATLSVIHVHHPDRCGKPAKVLLEPAVRPTMKDCSWNTNCKGCHAAGCQWCGTMLKQANISINGLGTCQRKNETCDSSVIGLLFDVISAIPETSTDVKLIAREQCGGMDVPPAAIASDCAECVKFKSAKWRHTVPTEKTTALLKKYLDEDVQSFKGLNLCVPNQLEPILGALEPYAQTTWATLTNECAKLVKIKRPFTFNVPTTTGGDTDTRDGSTDTKATSKAGKAGSKAGKTGQDEEDNKTSSGFPISALGACTIWLSTLLLH